VCWRSVAVWLWRCGFFMQSEALTLRVCVCLVGCCNPFCVCLIASCPHESDERELYVLLRYHHLLRVFCRRMDGQSLQRSSVTPCSTSACFSWYSHVISFSRYSRRPKGLKGNTGARTNGEASDGRTGTNLLDSQMPT